MKIKRLLIALAVAFFSAASLASAETAEAPGASVFIDDSSIIKNLVILCDGGGMRFSLAASASQGMRRLELLSGSSIVAAKECYGSEMCRMTGIASLASLSSGVITAVASDKSGREQRERVRLNVENSDPKVYMITSMPMMEGFAPAIMADGEHESGNAPEAAKSDEKQPPAISGELSSAVKGPDMSATIKKNGSNDYTISIFARDDSGVNFIQILENGSFYDVERCEDKKECGFTKNVKNRKPGRNSYLIKSMNSKGALSFQEEFLVFSAAE